MMAAVYEAYMGGPLQPFLTVVDGNGNTASINLPSGASTPDVVIGDNGGSFPYLSGCVLTVGVVYELSGAVYYQQYDVTVGAPPTISAAGAPVQISGSGTAKSPHIDMFPDYGNESNDFSKSPKQAYAMHEYVIEWSENNSGWDIWAMQGDFWSGSTTTQQITTGGAGEYGDVACVFDRYAITQTAYFVIYNPSGSTVDWGYWDITNSLYGTSSMESVVSTVERPRIEAFNTYNSNTSGGNVGEIIFHAVAQVNTGTTYDEVHSYMWDGSTVAKNNYSFIDMPLASLRHYNPAISAGIREANGNIGNDKFIIGWYMEDPAPPNPPFTDGYYALKMDISVNGATSTCSGGYNQVNNFSVSGVTASLNAPAIAFGTCSNSGYGLVSLWFDGTTVILKESNNTFQFKPTEVGLVNNLRNVSLFPNPAKGEVFVSDTKDASYTLSDGIGRFIRNGSITQTMNRIPVNDLTPGVYFINIIESNRSSKLKFVKE